MVCKNTRDTDGLFSHNWHMTKRGSCDHSGLLLQNMTVRHKPHVPYVWKGKGKTWQGGIPNVCGLKVWGHQWRNFVCTKKLPWPPTQFPTFIFNLLIGLSWQITSFKMFLKMYTEFRFALSPSPWWQFALELRWIQVCTKPNNPCYPSMIWPWPKALGSLSVSAP